MEDVDQMESVVYVDYVDYERLTRAAEEWMRWYGRARSGGRRAGREVHTGLGGPSLWGEVDSGRGGLEGGLDSTNTDSLQRWRLAGCPDGA